MSFEWICQALDYQPNVLRRRLLVTLGKIKDATVQPIVFDVKHPSREMA